MKFLISRLKEDVNKRRQFFHSLLKFGLNRAVRIRLWENFSLALERTYLCNFRQRTNTKLLYTKEV